MSRRELGWQIASLVRLELRRGLFSRRAIPLYLLAAVPLAIVSMMAFLGPKLGVEPGVAELKGAWAGLYQAFVLRVVVYFGSVWIFMNLFRGEVVDRTLHFYLLSPLRREVLLVGKFLSGLVIAFTLFAGTTVVSYCVLFLRYTGPSGLAVGELASYAGISALGCIGYGSLFLLAGLLFRNPALPAIAFFGWEWLNFLLPPLLKKVSVIHYLKWLDPVPAIWNEGPFALPSDPTPAPLAIGGLLVFATILLAIGALVMRRVEIQYGGE